MSIVSLHWFPWILFSPSVYFVYLFLYTSTCIIEHQIWSRKSPVYKLLRVLPYLTVPAQISFGILAILQPQYVFCPQTFLIFLSAWNSPFPSFLYHIGLTKPNVTLEKHSWALSPLIFIECISYFPLFIIALGILCYSYAYVWICLYIVNSLIR